MEPDLHALRHICGALDVRAPAALGIDRPNLTIVALHQIELCDHAQRLGGERDGAGVDGRGLVDGLGFRHRTAGIVGAAVGEAALGGIGTVGPFALHPFEIGEARAVDELVNHTGRQEGNLGTGGERIGEGELGLAHFVFCCGTSFGTIEAPRCQSCCRVGRVAAGAHRIELIGGPRRDHDARCVEGASRSMNRSVSIDGATGAAAARWRRRSFRRGPDITRPLPE